MHQIKKIGNTFSILLHGKIELIGGIATRSEAEAMVATLQG
jgi:hypothetical protein